MSSAALGAARWSDDELARIQRRTTGTLVAAQALGGLGITIGIAVAAVLAEEISGSARLAGLVQTMQTLGAALGSFLLAHLMGLRGRRFGLALGYLLGATGAALCVLAGVAESFALLLLGAGLLGATTASNLQSRYAATDLARPERRARALSLVVWATTIGAVAGPNLTGVAGRVAVDVGLPRLTGPFLLGGVGIALAGVVVTALLRPDPLLVAREAAIDRGDAGTVRHATPWRRVWEVARSERGVAAGVAGLALAHASMIAVMVMTPLHMHHGGATLQLIGLVVSIHVLGMFFFAPVVGWLADRRGRPLTMGVGALLLLVALGLAAVSPEGASWQIGSGLFLLGLGWSFVTVASSALLSESAPLDARTDVQGAADLVMGLVAATAGALAGLVMGSFGFVALTGFGALLVVGVAVAAVVARRADTPVAA